MNRCLSGIVQGQQWKAMRVPSEEVGFHLPKSLKVLVHWQWLGHVLIPHPTSMAQVY